MSKKLAIRGHSARGKEVIELLKMMGGSDSGVSGSIPQHYYYLDTPTHIDVFAFESDFFIRNKDNFVFYTIDEFLKKYPFKVGDKVIDVADGCPGIVSEMKWDAHVSDMKYCVVFGNGIDFGWFANGSIEFCKENKSSEETQSKRDIDKSEFVIKNMILPNKVDDKLEYEIIDGYEFDRIENNRIILKPIKPKYPKTYEECCDILSIIPYYNLRYHTFEHGFHELATSNELLSLQDTLNIFGKLLICRKAYWKIAGEQLGLDKPWKPTYETLVDNTYFTIHTFNGEIVKSGTSHRNSILAFPTEEMRDAFYDNFEDFIEYCKGLL